MTKEHPRAIPVFYLGVGGCRRADRRPLLTGNHTLEQSASQ
jgi:hypothetical protein